MSAEQVTVYKLDEHGDYVWHYPAVVLSRQPHCVRLEAFFNRDDVDLGYVVFRRGDRFVEYFYNDRWYNIFVVYDADNRQLKGWYCNICRPAELGEEEIRADDLALDVWIDPQGDVRVLDEDEFADLNLRHGERVQAVSAVQELQRLAARNKLPQ